MASLRVNLFQSVETGSRLCVQPQRFLTQFLAKILRSLQQTAAEPPNWWKRTERQTPGTRGGPWGTHLGSH